MKILVVNYDDRGVSVNLVQALIKNNVDVIFAVCFKGSDLPFVVQMPRKKCISFFRRMFIRFCNTFLKYTTTNRITHSTNFYSEIDVNWINNQNVDVVHMHWICANMISIKDISKINKPILWTLHDSWAFCGAEHHPNILENDDRFMFKYTKKNKPKTTKGYDICKKTQRLKEKYLKNKDIVFITPSKWEREMLKKSFLFSQKECHVIGNIVSQEIYHSVDKIEIRKMLGIPLDKKILGFGAAYEVDNPKSLKGTKYLLEALKKIEKKEDYFLVIFGPAGKAFTDQIDIPYKSFGYISVPCILNLIYNLCDLFLHPSLIENLPTTAIEANLCAVPVVSFNVGGFPDIINHKITGYMANPYDVNDFYTGMLYCLDNIEALAKEAYRTVSFKYDNKKIVDEHVALYTEVKNEFDKKNNYKNPI